MGRRRTGARDPRVLCAGLIAVVMIGCSTRPQSGKPAPSVDKAAHITQFYARDPTLPIGEKTVLCYGVANAKSVHLSPPVDKVWPAFTRCIEIAPAKETTYTLTAEGEDGRPVSQSVTVQIGPPLAKILDVSVNAINVHPGDQVTVCYNVKNAKSVKVEPGRPLSLGVASPTHGCSADRPKKTTTYTVTAYGAGGNTDSERVTVYVK